MKTTYRFAWISTFFTYLVIFTGGLVRVSGAGLGCPDWPKCFGRWIPPFVAEQLPGYIDPSLFNFTLAWIEYVNRLLGLILGLLIVITAIMVFRNYRKIGRIFWSAVASGLIVSALGWQGGRVVESDLEPVIVSLHAVLAMLLVSIMIYMTMQIYYQLNPDEEKTSVYPIRMTLWLALLWGASLAQVVIGAKVRGTLEVLLDIMPLADTKALLSHAGGFLYLHMLFGILLAVAGIIIALRIL